METLHHAVNSLKPLIESSKELTRTSQKLAEKVAFSTAKARYLMGQFRRGEANDPGTYVVSVAEVLSRYSEAIVLKVTDPCTGLASKGDWLPTIHEIVQACEQLAAGAADAANRQRLIETTLQDRAKFDESKAKPRPTLEALREKYGPNWGITQPDVDRAERHLARLARDEASTQAKILAEYHRINREPVYARDGMIISPGLLDLIEPFRYREPQ